MKRILSFFILLSILALFTGCQTSKPILTDVTEENAGRAAEWVKMRSGLIENAVQAITHVAVYSSDSNTVERTRTIEVMHAIAGNLNALIANGKVDSQSIKEALKIDEPYFGTLMNSIADLVQIEIGTFKDNGYASLTVAILTAVSRGIADGTVE
jgi:hypothetical protein